MLSFKRNKRLQLQHLLLAPLLQPQQSHLLLKLPKHQNSGLEEASLGQVEVLVCVPARVSVLDLVHLRPIRHRTMEIVLHPTVLH